MVFLILLKYSDITLCFFFLICYIIHIKNKYSALLSSQLLGLKGNIHITETEKS